MIKIILRYLTTIKNKTFCIEELLFYMQKAHSEEYEGEGGYPAFYTAVVSLVNDKIISEVKTSGRYFMTPPLYNRYRILAVNRDKTEINNIKQEIMCLNTALDKQFYLSHMEKYISDREYIQLINSWINKPEYSELIKYRCTINERSFQIFNDEKFLAAKGIAIINSLGLTLESLNCYRTYEAFFYILFGKRKRGNALIIENKDSFMSLLYHCQKLSKSQIDGINIDMLIYGEGKKIISSFGFMQEIKKRFLADKVFYWGDLDYTGIEIFINLKKKYAQYDIIPHKELYMKMLENASNPPIMRTSQNKVDAGVFTDCFDKDTADAIKRILNDGLYIPQEAVIIE